MVWRVWTWVVSEMNGNVKKVVIKDLSKVFCRLGQVNSARMATCCVPFQNLTGRDSWGWGYHWYSQIRELVHFPGSRKLLKFFLYDFHLCSSSYSNSMRQKVTSKSIIPRALQSSDPLPGFISCSYPGLKAGWSLTGGVQLRKLSRECSSEIVLTIPACWKMCLGPGGLGNPFVFLASQSCLVATNRECVYSKSTISVGVASRKVQCAEWSQTQKIHH